MPINPCERCISPARLVKISTEKAEHLQRLREFNLVYWDDAVNLTSHPAFTDEYRANMSSAMAAMVTTVDNIVTTMETALQEAEATTCSDEVLADCPKLRCIISGIVASEEDKQRVLGLSFPQPD